MRLTTRTLLVAAVSLIPLPGSAQDRPAVAPTYDELQAMIARMRQQVETLGTKSAERDEALRFLTRQVDDAAGKIAGDDGTASSLRGQAASLSETVEGLSVERARLEREAGERAQVLSTAEQQMAILRSGLDAAEAGRTTAVTDLSTARARIAALEAEVATARGSGEAALTKALAEVAALRADRAALSERLAGAEGERDRQVAAVADLDGRLKRALAEDIDELARYRTEFFDRLREVLGERGDIRVIGDRFIFQSELLFASGSSELDEGGTLQLGRLAQALFEVSVDIPANVDWLLRVDGHTDRRMIRSRDSRANWELSVARAISVVEYLVGEGIAPERLAATGFGEFRPLDPRDDEIAYRRNRRIEFKLTEG